MTDEMHPRLGVLLELRHQAPSLGLASPHLVNTTFSGLYASVFRGQGLNFEEVREYREGDDIRNMDWKVTARTNEPHLKVYREERERNVLLCVDHGPHMFFGTRGTFKSVQAARAAASASMRSASASCGPPLPLRPNTMYCALIAWANSLSLNGSGCFVSSL